MNSQILKIGLIAVAISIVSSTQLEAQTKLKLTARYQIEKGTRNGWIVVSAEIPEGNHIYALTQKGTPPPTKIKIAASDDFSVTKKFKPNKKPKVIEKDPVFESRVEKHEGKVAFLATITIADGVDIEELFIDLKFHGQICSDTACIPLRNKPIPVEFGGYFVKTDKKKDK